MCQSDLLTLQEVVILCVVMAFGCLENEGGGVNEVLQCYNLKCWLVDVIIPAYKGTQAGVQMY